MPEAINDDLNAVITSAVQARVEAQVLEALSGDNTIGKFVMSALQQDVEVKDGYNRKKAPFITHVLRKTFQDATRAAVAKLVEEERPHIEREVRQALRRNVDGIATQLVDALSGAAESTYSFKIDIGLRGQ